MVNWTTVDGNNSAPLCYLILCFARDTRSRSLAHPLFNIARRLAGMNLDEWKQFCTTPLRTTLIRGSAREGDSRRYRNSRSCRFQCVFARWCRIVSINRLGYVFVHVGVLFCVNFSARTHASLWAARRSCARAAGWPGQAAGPPSGRAGRPGGHAVGRAGGRRAAGQPRCRSMSRQYRKHTRKR